MASRAPLLAVAVLVAAALLPATASAASYRVGDDSGWDNGVDYDAWAGGKKFKVGDTLEFLYSEGFHNVVVVDAASYAACAIPGNAPTLTSGDDRVALRQAGQWFFICGVAGHCESGMKLAVNVH
ncbi:hypothetical protein PR202_gb10685 [Eleusine coracana subsp. coracana]|uniref:Phytocyanin domain-containing protein n=1 Tax=Eleusine coracana subsp. coracana TaxID=191504 RepID=A0AAV5EI96_ELECO|nr:hypothetical protein QOZ80_3AG0213100 [Eleusine coracana subsp. coracana]GJN23068.1 hypothetical protein PR202_gb10685 [Eleusine coracana subsp. coracana]